MTNGGTAYAHYSAFSRIVHWLTVLLMAGMFYTGFVGFGGGPPGGGRPGGTMAMRGPMPGAPGGTMAMRAGAPGATMAMHGPNAPGAAPGGAPGGAMMAMRGPGGPGGAGGPPREQSPWGLIPLHKAMGFTILVLAFLRITYRIFARNRFPELPPEMPKWQIQLARGIQGLIYIMLLVQPLSGWLGSGRAFTWFGVFTMPPITFLSGPYGMPLRWIHTNGAWVLIGLITLHTLGALYHHYIRRDNVLLSMIRGA